MHDFSAAARARALWATDAPAACGVSEYTTPAALWAIKTGQAEPEDISDRIPVRLGKACESGILSLYKEDTGDDIRPLHALELFTEEPGYPMGSHFDAINRTSQMLIEVKMFGAHRRKEFGAPGTDAVPMDVLTQVLHEMAVFNLCDDKMINGVEIVVAFGNMHLEQFVVPWDQGAIDQLHRQEGDFWSKVLTGTAPEPQSPDDARKVWASSDGSELEATGEALAAYEALVSVRTQLKNLDAQEEKLKLWIMKYMRGADLLSAAGERLCAWSNRKGAERIDTKLLRKKFPDVAAACIKVGDASRVFLVK